MALWRFVDIKIISFSNIDFHYPLWVLMMVQDSDTWHNQKMPHDILIVFWNKMYILVTK